MGLERFARASKPLTFHSTPGIGEATWKSLIDRHLIVPAIASSDKWWRVPHTISEAGRAALQSDAAE
jgi:hypothetical protein